MQRFSCDPVLVKVPMPLRTPSLLLRPWQAGDGTATAEAIGETWDELHTWMEWAQRPEHNTPENQEIHFRRSMAKFILREELNLLGLERVTGLPVIWCGFHNFEWALGHCEIGYWVRKSAQGRGFATEATNALLRYGFGALGMHRVGISHAGGNQKSKRVIEKLGFSLEGIQRRAVILPSGQVADRHLYARLDLDDLPGLKVSWGPD